MTLSQLFDAARAAGASDLHLALGAPPTLRVDGKLSRMAGLPPLSAEALEALLTPLLTPARRLQLEAGSAASARLVEGEIAFLVTCFRAEGALQATVRLLRGGIPPLEQVAGDAAELLAPLARLPRGLVLISGAPGSGKWTTASSLADACLRQSACRLFVLEDDPGYAFAGELGVATTLQIGVDAPRYADALQTALRADPDVLLVADLPDGASVRAALTLASTGHLVIVQIHARSAVAAAIQVANAARQEGELWHEALLGCFAAATGQILQIRSEGRRTASFEVLARTPAVMAALRDGNEKRLIELQASEPGCRRRKSSSTAGG